MSKLVPLGTRATVERRVARENTLQRFHDEFPPVLSTPEMIGLMEWACYEAQQPFCDEGEMTVGTRVCVDHVAATAVGALVHAEAVLTKIDGKSFIYRVRAWDDQKELGYGTVHRAVINLARFSSKLKS
jgi:fluoroacetyl-CoA thioesterase